MKALLASLMFVCTSVSAQYQSGNDLHKDLNDSSAQSKMYALGYIVGVTDSVLDIAVCIPAGVTQGQLQDVMKNYLHANPQNRDVAAHILVIAALAQHWPCANRRKKS
jgi:hypothetical protein